MKKIYIILGGIILAVIAAYVLIIEVARLLVLRGYDIKCYVEDENEEGDIEDDDIVFDEQKSHPASGYCRKMPK